MAAAPSPSQRIERNLTRIIAAAARCPWEPPRTFFEGLNTLWFIREITGYADGVSNYALGRPDAWLIDLYRADLAAGRLTLEEARDLVACFLLVADCHHDGDIPVDSYSDHEAEIPLTLGGCDTEGRPVWVDGANYMSVARVLELTLHRDPKVERAVKIAIGAIDHSRLYASNANLAFEKSAMSTETFEAVFRVVCKKRMHLLQPNSLPSENSPTSSSR